MELMIETIVKIPGLVSRAEVIEGAGPGLALLEVHRGEEGHADCPGRGDDDRQINKHPLSGIDVNRSLKNMESSQEIADLKVGQGVKLWNWRIS